MHNCLLLLEREKEGKKEKSLYNIGNRYLSLFDLINVSKGMIPRFGSIANTPVSNFHSVFLQSFFPCARTCPCAAWLFQWPGREWHHFVRPRHPVARRKSIPFAPCEVEATQTHRTGREVVLSAKLCSTIAGPAIGVRYSVQPFHPRAAYGRPTNFRVCELVIRVSLRIETTQNLLHSFRD